MLSIPSVTLIMSMLAIFMFSMQRTNILMLLLTFELLILIIIPSYSILQSQLSITPILTLLTLGACEASLGLSILALMSRYSGSDKINTLSTPL